ncbi:MULTISPECIES: flavin reductase family protein [Bacillus]|uniref:flavin reductase family protein n=1 Tax=Bacillus TaxID=1386 RepID=UPI0003FDEE26|nr:MULTISPECIES: flavin reductase family protein [Bacillus]QHZ45489.1 flavin reductase family protein [Bacillus sp. NSP9.1]WFA04712.1 flavin reductase family protein [Bacillus sp. HSf4]
MNQTIKEIEPSILYYGTPVILLSTLNEDGSTNISPLSSSWALGDCIVLGAGTSGKAFENIQRERQCVINVPDPSLWRNVEQLAPLTGKHPVPKDKERLGFTFHKRKFAASGFMPAPSLSVKPDRIAECPLQIEAEAASIRIPEHSPFFAVIETKVLKVHAHERIIKEGNHIDPQKWSPLIYNFRHYFRLGDELGKTFRA